jgi:hypothetical protein
MPPECDGFRTRPSEGRRPGSTPGEGMARPGRPGRADPPRPGLSRASDSSKHRRTRSGRSAILE